MRSLFSRSFLLRLALSLAVLAGAVQVGTAGEAVAPAEAATTCPNSECHGWQMCQYWPGVICALSARSGSCTAWKCP